MVSPPAPSPGNSQHLTVLALNSGSSSLKFGLYSVGAAGTEPLLTGIAELIDSGGGKFHVQDAKGGSLPLAAAPVSNLKDAIVQIESVIAETNMPSPAAVGHRIVHGGLRLRQHCLINAAVMREIESAAAFAPLHARSASTVIQSAQHHFKSIPHIACFDTVFHAELPDIARVLPLPKELRSEGIQRYGFHGLSCESIVHQLADAVPHRLIIAHLGNGASVTAVKAGKSIDTSMGLTPSGGVIMGTRSGDLDPGTLIYLVREKKFDAMMLEDLIDHRCGLLGISGVSSDMRRLHETSETDKAARLAIDMFCYAVRKQIAAMMAALGGVDMIVFTGGIGENDANAREAICAGLSWAGVSLDPALNRAASGVISTPASSVAVQVLASQEDEQIARRSSALISKR